MDSLLLGFALFLSSEVYLIAMKKGYFFLLDIAGLIVTFKVNQVVLGNPYLYALENSGSLLVQRLPRNGNASGDEAVSRAVPNGVDLCQAHWKLGIMTWKRETPLSEWSLQMLL